MDPAASGGEGKKLEIYAAAFSGQWPSGSATGTNLLFGIVVTENWMEIKEITLMVLFNLVKNKTPCRSYQTRSHW